MWVWVVLGAIVIAMLATSPTVHAVLRRSHRLYTIENTGCLLGDEIRDRWRRGDGDEVRLIWAYYRLVRGWDPPRTWLEWFWQERSLLREVNVALRDRPLPLGARLRLLAWPGLLWSRIGRPRRPRLPLRNRLWRLTTFWVGDRLVHGDTRPRPDLPFLFSGDFRHRAGWYSFPFWDDGWRSELAELGPRPEHLQTAAWREVTSVSFDRYDRRESLEVRQAALDERMNRIHDEISEHTAQTIQSSVAEAVEKKDSDRDDPAPSADTGGGVRGGGSSGGGSRSSSYDRDDWGSGGYDGADW